jgi:6-pyruvoyltetrahydropterin/6-carboxytetrahydropterin synthase
MSVPMRVQLTRVIRFSAAHRYHSDELSDAENRRVFGKCNLPHGHGHDYRVEVTVLGEIDPVTGMVINLADLDSILQEHVVDALDHRFLNLDVAHFSKVVPTCENLATYIFGLLQELLRELPANLCGVRVWEGQDLSADVIREDSP